MSDSQSNSSNSQQNSPTSSNDNITNFTLNQTITEPSLTVVNQQGTTDSGNNVTHTTFTTTSSQSDVQINEDLKQVVSSYYDDTTNQQLINQIRNYAGQIQCSDFHGKGSIDDYQQLFVAASKIATDTKQMTLDIDVQGFNDFGKAADELSALFNSFIVKLQNISIINDTSFLTSIANALAKIVNLSNTFGKFKKTIVATSSIQLPKTAHDTKVVLETVAAEINCAMNYINYFVDSTAPKPQDADLSSEEQNIITKAINTIDNWNVLSEQGVSIALSNNTDVQFIKLVNNDLKSKTNQLNVAMNKLKSKLDQYKI
jgi:hypothetical protein